MTTASEGVRVGDVGRSAATSGATQFAARLFDVVVTWLLSIVVLRYLEPAGFGDYALIAGLSGLMGVCAEFGLVRVATREISRDPAIESPVLGSVIVLRLASAMVAIASVQLLLTLFEPTSALRFAALVASTAFLAEALLSVVVVFHLRMVQHLEAVARLCGTIVRAALTLTAVAAGAGLAHILAAQVLALFVTAAVAWQLARSRWATRPRFERVRMRSLAREALPVGPAAVIGVVYLKLDVVMLGLLEDRASLGIYGAAYQPIEYLLLLSAVAFYVLFPLLAAVALTDRDAFLDRYRLGSDLLVIAYGAGAVVIVALAPTVVKTLYDTPYSGAATPMIILGAAVGFMALNAWQGGVLLAVGEQRRNLMYLVGAAVVNVLVDLVLIVQFGYVGAAWGTLITAVGLGILSTVGVKRHAGLTLDGRSVGPFVVAAVVGCLVAGAARSWLGAVIGGLCGLLVWAVIAALGLPAFVMRAKALGAASLPIAPAEVAAP